MLTMTTEKGNAGNVLLSGSLTRKAKEKQFEVNNDDDHIVNMYVVNPLGSYSEATNHSFSYRGKIIEDIEIAIRGEVSVLILYSSPSALLR